MIKRTAVLIPAAIFFFVCLSVSAQTPTPAPATEELQQRVRQLETQMETLRGELQQLRQTLPARHPQALAPQAASESRRTSEAVPVVAARAGRDDATTANPINHTTASATAQTTPPPPTQAAQTPPERRLPGFELGAVRAVPYGTIYFNAFGNSGGTNNADVPLFATPSGAGNLSASVRQTRLGLRLQASNILRASLTGVVEADFFGGFPAIGIGENFSVVRVRLANARLDWERTSLTIGQDWMIFAPNNPTSIAAAGIPQLAAAGNNWARLPQIKLERRFGQRSQFKLQGAILSPSTGDFPPGTNSPALLQPGAGAASRLPFLQARAAFVESNAFGTTTSGTIGLSAHYGRARVITGNFNDELDSTGLALDWNAPLFTSRLTTVGEAFFGRNLAGFQGGIFQGYNTEFASRQGGPLLPSGVRSIGTRGGWTQIGFTPPAFDDRFTAFASFGVDDPRDEDLTSLTRRDFRARNAAYAVSFLYKLTPQLNWSIEFRRFETQYLFSNRQTANHLNVGAAFSF